MGHNTGNTSWIVGSGYFDLSFVEGKLISFVIPSSLQWPLRKILKRLSLEILKDNIKGII